MLDLFDQIIYVAAKAMPNSEPSLQMTLYSSLSLSLSQDSLERERERDEHVAKDRRAQTRRS